MATGLEGAPAEGVAAGPGADDSGGLVVEGASGTEGEREGRGGARVMVVLSVLRSYT